MNPILAALLAAGRIAGPLAKPIGKALAYPFKQIKKFQKLPQETQMKWLGPTSLGMLGAQIVAQKKADAAEAKKYKHSIWNLNDPEKKYH